MDIDDTRAFGAAIDFLLGHWLAWKMMRRKYATYKSQDCLKRQLSSVCWETILVLHGPEIVARSIEGDSMARLRLRIRLSGIVLFVSLSGAVFSQAQEKEDFDAYKLRIDAGWFYTNPSGSIHGETDTGSIDFQKDLGFNSYSTFSGKIDWKFTRKNHLYVAIIPFYKSGQTVLNRTFTFQGQTFTAGLTTNSSIDMFATLPGYQYDFIRRKRGHLGLALQMDLFDTTAKINAAAQVTGDGVHHSAVSASGSLLSPIPVAGPDIRFYLTDSPRVFVAGNVLGMYLFGYGNFVSTVGDVGVNLSKHFAVIGGYQLGSHLVVNNTNDRIGLRFTQKGAIAGLEASF
jgi:hypothetical protein